MPISDRAPEKKVTKNDRDKDNPNFFLVVLECGHVVRRPKRPKVGALIPCLSCWMKA